MIRNSHYIESRLYKAHLGVLQARVNYTVFFNLLSGGHFVTHIFRALYCLMPTAYN